MIGPAGLLVASLAAPIAVPFVPQQKDTCGAASLAMVLRFWGVAADHDELAAAAAEAGQRGASGARLAELARARGLFALAYEGDLRQLEESLEKGRPIVVALGAGSGRLQHDVVVVGIEAGHVLLHDPSEGRDRRVRTREFERRWSATGHWSLLVLPRP
jgi:ABC-type bacteriocin/lantibiotic exporter with double-glycine peptidase domain